MGTLISVYSAKAYKEFILPDYEDIDHQLVLRKNDFDMEEDAVLDLENIAGEWYLKPSYDYSVKTPDSCAEGRTALEHGKYVVLELSGSEMLRLSSYEVKQINHAFRRYDITGVNVISIGRDEDNDICFIGGGLVSKHHVLIKRRDGSLRAENIGKNGFYINSERVISEAVFGYGDLLDLMGLRIVQLGDHIAVSTPEEGVVINDKLSIYKKRKIDNITDVKSKCKLIARQNIYDTDIWDDKEPHEITIAEPVVGASHWKGNYLDYIGKIEIDLKEKTYNYLKSLERSKPSAMDCLNDDEIQIPVWDKWPGSSGMFDVRIGRGVIRNPYSIRFDEGKLFLADRDLYKRVTEIRNSYDTISDAPYSVDLDGVNEVAIKADRRDDLIAAEEIIAVQLAQHVSPENLKMVFISSEHDQCTAEWDSLRWLPHVWSEDMSFRFFARNDDAINEVMYRLSKVISSREGLPSEEIKLLPRYFVFFCGSTLQDSLVGRYNESRKYLGFTIIKAAGNDIDSLHTNKILIEQKGNLSCVYRARQNVPEEFRIDTLDKSMLAGFVRRTASVSTGRASGIMMIPDHVSFSDITQYKNITAADIKNKWTKSRTYDHICGIIGKSAGGIDKKLDLHERYDGPHSLIVGTTGAGKSELLRSYIVSLAMEYSPEDLSFVLIDFKGGGMTNALQGLPHVAGCVTNLSGREISRAVLAVKSEIMSRQKAFGRLKVDHIDDYTRLYKHGDITVPIPHLVIVIDEFAELKRERPDLMSEFIMIAQTGRSLGVHLILATQKARGNVDDNIRSNMHSVICLRVQDKNDSLDVLDRPDAAYITGAGRGFVRVGAEELFEPFQALYSGDRADAEKTEAGSIKLITDTGKIDVISSFEERDTAGLGETQLEALIEKIIKVAGDLSSHAKRLWLDPLKKDITLSDVCVTFCKDNTAAIPMGMVDDPAERLQYPLELRYPEAGNTAIVGMPSSGKTTAVKTILKYITDHIDTACLKIYFLGSEREVVGMYQASPIVVRASDIRNAMDIELMLEDVAELVKAREHIDDQKQIYLIILDSYEDFRISAGYKGESEIAELMRKGPGENVYFIITGGGFNMGQIPGSIERNIKTVICLSQKNKFEYMDALRTADLSILPDNRIKGRGIILKEGRTLEFQTAYPD